MTDTTTCPNCQEPMSLGHVIPRLAGHPEVRSFQCSSCGEVLGTLENDDRNATRAKPSLD